MTKKVKDPTGDGRTTRWEAHREERRAELVAAAVAAVDRHGPEASIADIAEAAGVSKPVLYRYFADKDELHGAVGQWAADEVLARMMPALLADLPMRQRVAGATDGYLSLLDEHPRVFQLLVRHRTGGSDPLADGKARIAAAFARVLGEMLRELGLDAGGAEPWAQGLVGLGLSTGEWWLERRTMTRAAVGAYLTSFVWHAFEGTAAELGVPVSSLDLPQAAPTPIDSTTPKGRRG